MVKERIEKFRNLMKKNELDAYIIKTSDYHNSEYVSDYFKEREYMSGFTGSAGTLVVTLKKAALWTDGRYFLQAEEELKGSGIELMRQGEEGVKDITAYVLDELEEGDGLGFDGRTFDAAGALNLIKKACEKGIRIKANIDLPDELWEERPALPKEKVWEYGVEYAGEEREEKIKRLREKMREYEAECHILCKLDDIAWLLNLRGNDVLCTPVFLAYMVIFEERAYLYADKEIFSDKIKESLRDAGVEIRKYNDIYANIKALAVYKILIDRNNVNFAIINSIGGDKTIINKMNPTTIMKSVKNETEIEGFRKAHVKDGVAVTKFMCWLKKNIGKLEMTEMSLSDKILEFRKEQEGFMEESFEPIMAYGKHGAIVHYSATEKTDIKIENRSLLLSDTGAHYLGGSTDITRTFVCGELTEEEKKIYTLVLCGNLRLAAAVFPKGMRGDQLDIIARGPLLKYGYDFNHGTGHGIGNVLSVHEGPQNISYRNKRFTDAEFKEGMITSNEPGMYIADEFGVRLENVILCKNIDEKRMGFETITLVPFERDAIDKKYMSSDDIELLNEYHKKVRETLMPYMDGEEKEWLHEVTEEV